jgi:glutamyl-Q tRNA(Asp) synthetase
VRADDCAPHPLASALPASIVSTAYVGRFAPSPTGPLHAGSLVAALASWLDARAWNGGRGGRWLVRIEDVDTPRCVPGVDREILAQLAACGLHPDAPPVWQSQRDHHYAAALEQLQQQGWSYPCACTRKQIEAAWASQGLTHERHVERPYPGTCRHGLQGQPARAWRFQTEKYQSFCQDVLTSKELLAPFLIANNQLHWQDRRLGAQQQDVAATVGDFVLLRADGLWAYQLAVVVDDAAQGITHIVRGEDLADNTPRQLLLQQALGVAAPRYLHTPLVRATDGEKLSKQHGAPALDLREPLQALQAAAAVLGLPHIPSITANPLSDALAQWVQAWADIYNPSL